MLSIYEGVAHRYCPRKKKRVSERVSPRVMHIGSDLRLSARLLADSRRDSRRNFWRNFSRKRVLPRVSDRILCMTLGETLSETRSFTLVSINLLWNSIEFYMNGQHSCKIIKEVSISTSSSSSSALDNAIRGWTQSLPFFYCVCKKDTNGYPVTDSPKLFLWKIVTS